MLIQQKRTINTVEPALSSCAYFPSSVVRERISIFFLRFVGPI